jgi:hypothetical protein
MELKVDLGPMPEDDHSGGIIDGLRSLQEKDELCDVVLIVGEQSFQAHRAVLAAVSSSFHECLKNIGSGEGPNGLSEPKSLHLKLEDISHPEAVKAMLDCIYHPRTAYAPSGEDANRDVLRLAQRFKITQLEEAASNWLTSGVSTVNVLDRLLACEEFKLEEVRERILEQLVCNPEALYALAKDPEIIKVPNVLQDLLVRILQILGVHEEKTEVKPEPPVEAKSEAKADVKMEAKADAKTEAKTEAAVKVEARAQAPKASQGRAGRRAGA